MLSKHREMLSHIKGEIIGLSYAVGTDISLFLSKLGRDLGEVLDEDASTDVFVEGDMPKTYKMLKEG